MDEKPLTDNQLRALLAGIAPGAEPPDAVLVAAWLEGRLDESTSARVETWLAANAEARGALLALRDATPEPAPDTELARLRALVPPAPKPRAARSVGWRAAVTAALSTWPPSPRVAIASVAFVALCAWLGLAAGERLAEAQWARQAGAAFQYAVLLDAGG